MDAVDLEKGKKRTVPDQVSFTEFVDIAGNKLYIAKTNDAKLEIYKYSIKNNKVNSIIKTDIEAIFNPIIKFYKDKILFVDYTKHVISVLNSNGEKITNIDIENNFPPNIHPGRKAQIIINNNFLYVFNPFVNDRAIYNIQKYDFKGNLLEENTQTRISKLYKNTNKLYSIYYNNITELNFQLDKIRSHTLKGDNFSDDSKYVFFDDYLIAIDYQNIHITNLNDFYKVIPLYEIIESRSARDIILLTNQEKIFLIDKVEDAIYPLFLIH